MFVLQWPRSLGMYLNCKTQKNRTQLTTVCNLLTSGGDILHSGTLMLQKAFFFNIKLNRSENEDLLDKILNWMSTCAALSQLLAMVIYTQSVVLVCVLLCEVSDKMTF